MNNYSNKKGSLQVLKKILVTDFLMAHQLSLFLTVYFFVACMITDDHLTTS